MYCVDARRWQGVWVFCSASSSAVHVASWGFAWLLGCLRAVLLCTLSSMQGQGHRAHYQQSASLEHWVTRLQLAGACWFANCTPEGVTYILGCIAPTSGVGCGQQGSLEVRTATNQPKDEGQASGVGLLDMLSLGCHGAAAPQLPVGHMQRLSVAVASLGPSQKGVALHGARVFD